DPSVPVTKEIPPEKTREQQIPIVDALTNDVAARFQINVPNAGALPGVPDDVVTELPAVIDAGGVHRLQVAPLPKKIMLHVIQPHILQMEWLHEAYLTGDRRLLLESLLMLSTFQEESRTTSYQQAVDLLEDVLALPTNRDMAAHYR